MDANTQIDILITQNNLLLNTITNLVTYLLIIVTTLISIAITFLFGINKKLSDIKTINEKLLDIKTINEKLSDIITRLAEINVFFSQHKKT